MVNTFVPVSDVRKSLESLDNKRLNKQISECVSILGSIFNLPTTKGTERKGYKNHPAQKMWEGYETGLLEYYNTAIEVWSNRGGGIDNYQIAVFRDEEDPYYVYLYNVLGQWKIHRHYAKEAEQVPYWMGHEPTHASHRSNLLRKDPVFYGQFGWTEPPNLPYIWPSHYGSLEDLPSLNDLYQAAELGMEARKYMETAK
jgi:hypothetical protein